MGTELHSSRALLTRQRQFPSLVKMLLFCPSCSNVLTVSTTTHGPENDTINRLECQTCPYEFLLQGQYFERKTYVRKEREDVFGGERTDLADGVGKSSSVGIIGGRKEELVSLFACDSARRMDGMAAFSLKIF